MIDFNDVTVMVIKNSDHGECTAVNVRVDEDMNTSVRKFMIKGTPEQLESCKEGTLLFYVGAIYSRTKYIDITDNSLFIVKSRSKTLAKCLDVQDNFEGNRIALRLQELFDDISNNDKVYRCTYRMDNGVKKIVSCFSEKQPEEKYPYVEKFLKVCNDLINPETDEISMPELGTPNVVYWNSAQSFISAYIEFSDMPEIYVDKKTYIPGIMLTISDTGYCAPLIAATWKDVDADSSQYIIQQVFKVSKGYLHISKNLKDEMYLLEEIAKICKLQLKTAKCLNSGFAKFELPPLNSKNLLGYKKLLKLMRKEEMIDNYDNYRQLNCYTALICHRKIKFQDKVDPIAGIRLFCGEALSSVRNPSWMNTSAN